MDLLLDTHPLIWALSEPGLLPVPIRAALEDPSSTGWVSAAAAWEIAIKVGLGKIDFPLDELSDAMAEAGLVELSVTIRHATAVKRLPLHHRDPFDRLLIAQALEERLTVCSRDPVFARYDVRVLWSS